MFFIKKMHFKYRNKHSYIDNEKIKEDISCVLREINWCRITKNRQRKFHEAKFYQKQRDIFPGNRSGSQEHTKALNSSFPES